MAEERILITKCSSWCRALRMSCDPFDDKDSVYCDKNGKWERITEKECSKCKDPVLLGISRQEAIERMAKAIFVSERIHYQGSLNWEDYKESAKDMFWRKRAEAALNALLEGK